MKRMAILVAWTVVVFSFMPLNIWAQKADDTAPFGLTWGLSAEQVRGLDVKLKDAPTKNFGTSFVAGDLARALADQETTLLSFGYNDKLWRIVAASRSFENDPTGSTVKARYDELSIVLTEKYGRPTAFHQIGDSIYKEPRYFFGGYQRGALILVFKF